MGIQFADKLTFGVDRLTSMNLGREGFCSYGWTGLSTTALKEVGGINALSETQRSLH